MFVDLPLFNSIKKYSRDLKSNSLFRGFPPYLNWWGRYDIMMYINQQLQIKIKRIVISLDVLILVVCNLVVFDEGVSLDKA